MNFPSLNNHLRASVLLTALLSNALMGPGWAQAQTFRTLYNFTGSSDGAQPFAGLILSSNTLFGTTALGGNLDDGTVFTINSDGGGFRSLYSFNGFSDGFYSHSSLLPSGNTLYGTTYFGGPAN